MRDARYKKGRKRSVNASFSFISTFFFLHHTVFTRGPFFFFPSRLFFFFALFAFFCCRFPPPPPPFFLSVFVSHCPSLIMLSVSGMLNQVIKDEPRPLLPPLHPPSHHDHGLLKPSALTISHLLCEPPSQTPTLSPTSSPSPTDSLPAFPFPAVHEQAHHSHPPFHSFQHPVQHPQQQQQQQHQNDLFSRPLYTPSGASSPQLSPSLSTSSTASSVTSSSFKKHKRGSLPCQSQSPSMASLDAFSESHTTLDDDDDAPKSGGVKAKRRRANAKQLQILNQVFERTFFPSTQMRAELGRQLGMSPRTVQIWFQNKRQAMRTREKQRLLRMKDTDMEAAS